ncbi:MAG: hypothetical protein WBE41_23425 [Terracidiphilus sp.]
MNQFSSEWAAIRHSHDMDRLEGSTSAGKVLDAIANTGSAVATVGAVVAPVAAPAFGIARATFVGLGLFRKASKFGRPSIEQMIEDIETGADAKFRGIDARLDGNDSAKREFDARLQSQEAETARLSALFHGLRSSDPEKHKRLGAITVGCIFADDLKPEGLDDMMRATVELRDRDIFVLKTLSERQRDTGTFYPLTSGDGTINRPREVWQALERDKFITLTNQMEIRSSLERLKGVGFCAEIQMMESNWLPRVLVTPLGEEFLLRLQEVAALPQ